MADFPMELQFFLWLNLNIWIKISMFEYWHIISAASGCVIVGIYYHSGVAECFLFSFCRLSSTDTVPLRHFPPSRLRKIFNLTILLLGAIYFIGGLAGRGGLIPYFILISLNLTNLIINSIDSIWYNLLTMNLIWLMSNEFWLELNNWLLLNWNVIKSKEFRLELNNWWNMIECHF